MGNNNDRKRERADAIKTLKGMFMPFLRPMVRLARQAENGTVDLGRPATAISRIEREVDHAAADPKLQSITSEDVAAALAFLVDEKALQFPKPRLSGRRALLVNYFDRLEQHTPFATVPLLGGAQLFSRDFTEHLFATATHLQCAARFRTENRSEALRDVALMGIERLYYRLVDAVYEAECLLRGRRIRAETGGARLSDVCEWTAGSLPGFFERDANHIRNAAAHCHWRYLPRTDEIVLVDRRWSRRFRNVDLYRLLGRMIADVLILMDVHLAITAPRTMRLFCDAGALAVMGGREHARFDEAMVVRTMSGAFQRLADLGWVERPEASPPPAVTGPTSSPAP